MKTMENTLPTQVITLADGGTVRALLVALLTPNRYAYAVFTIDSEWMRIEVDHVERIEDGAPFEVPPAWLDF